MRLRVVVGRGTVRAEAWHRAMMVGAAESTWLETDELAERIAELRTTPGLAGASRCDVWLVAPLAQVRRLNDLPPVPPRELRLLVSHRASHCFRRNGVTLVVDADWERRLGHRRVALAAAAPEPVLEAILAGARASGLRIRSIRPLADGWGGLELLPQSVRDSRRASSVRRSLCLSLVGLLLWLCAGTAFAMRLSRAGDRAQSEITTLEPALNALSRLRQEVAVADASVLALELTRIQRGQVRDMVARIALALPDSAHLLEMEVDSLDAGQVTGVARHAQAVLAALARAGVQSPRFEGRPESIGSTETPRERFVVGFGGEKE